MGSTAEFRFDGGATWLNLLATKGRSFGPRPVERLATPEAAGLWLTLAGFSPASAVTAAELEEIVSLREALREVAMASIAEVDPPVAAAEYIDRIATSTAVLSLSGMLRDRRTPVQAALAVIAMQALVTVHGPDRALLKECAETDCRWVFLDTSGRRHWCPSPSCASRGRVRALRARQAETSAE
ncbi:CGNR zinc finger domain-containing protein [Leifsonia sp. NPDC058292]|uniref:CGNR zinc finger domain-containing protein n=1 Tax=Leifsonia sp. NPDC058292 TaxID=3346428 RepID=UPI0036DDBEEB